MRLVIVKANRRRSALLGSAFALPIVLELVGCGALQKPKDAPLQTELELAYDEGPPVERPLLPPASFEWLIKFEPNLPAYRPLRLRLLVAQPGALHIVLYQADAEGRPSTPLRTLDRDYAPELTSNGRDGKWLLESLSDVPLQTGPLFVGISVPAPGNDAARLWAAEKPSGSGTPAPAHVFQRDAEPATALQSSQLPLVPLVRLALVPSASPPAAVLPATTAAPKPAPAATPAPASAPPASSGPAPAAPGAPPNQP